MKKLSLIFAAAFAFFALACNPSENNAEDSITLNSESKVSVPAEGGEVEINFTATAAWRASSTDTDMARVKPAQGEAGSGTVTVTVSENGQTSERSATITIATAGGKKVSVEITQPAPGSIGISKTSYEIGPEGGIVEVIVTTNVTFEVSSNVDWISAASSKAIPEVSYNLQVDPNFVVEPRTGNVVFKADGFDPITVSVTQAPFEPFLEITGDLVISKNGGEHRLQVNANLDWDVDGVDLGDDVYISVERDGDEILIDIDPNVEAGSRSFVITAYAVDYEDVEYSVSVRQDGIADIVYNVSLVEMGFEPGSSADSKRLRMAYDGSKILVSTQDLVAVINPETGVKEKEIDLGDIPHFSIDNDDEGNIIYAGQYNQGETVEIYVGSDVNATPSLLASFEQPAYGLMANFRARGNVKGDGVISSVVSINPSNPAYMGVVDFKGGKAGELALATPALGGMWSAYFGIGLINGTSSADGAFYTGYAAPRNLYYSANLTDWSEVINMNNAGNESCNALSLAEVGGKNYLAIAIGAYFSYSNTRLEIYDVTDPEQPEQVVVLSEPIRRADFTEAYGSEDVIMLPGEDGKSLVVYYAELGRDTFAKVIIPLK